MAEIVRRDQKLQPFKDAAQEHWAQLKALLPPDMSPQRFVAVALMSVQNNPALAECNAQSFGLAILQAAALGLEVGSEAYLVPYKGKVQCQPGYMGMAKLAMNTNMVTAIWANVVREGDEFEEVLGAQPTLRHIRKSSLGAPFVAAYACSRNVRGEVTWTVLYKDQIEQRRKVSAAVRAGKSTPWDEWYEEMAMGKAIKAHTKTLPKSSTFRAAIMLHDAVDTGKTVPIEAILPEMTLPQLEATNGDAA